MPTMINSQMRRNETEGSGKKIWARNKTFLKSTIFVPKNFASKRVKMVLVKKNVKRLKIANQMFLLIFTNFELNWFRNVPKASRGLELKMVFCCYNIRNLLT